MTQPGIAQIPGILARTLFRLVARILFLVAGLFLAVGLALTFASILLATWRTPRHRRTQLATEILLSGVELIKDRRSVTKTDSH